VTGVRGWWRRPRLLALAAGGLAAVVAATVAPVVVWGADDAVRPTVIRIATGSPAAVYYKYGRAYADIINRELPGVRATVLVTTASVTNVQMVRDGRAEVAFAQADILSADLDTGGLAALARVYDDQLHLVVRAASGVRTLKDLAGRRVSTGAPGSGTFITAERLLRLAGLRPAGIQERRLGLDESVAALRAGEIDAFFFSGGLPVGAIAQLAAEQDQQRAIRLVDLGDWVSRMRSEYTDVYGERAVPTSVYRLPPISTIADPNYLVVSRDLPERIAYELTRILIERRTELDRAHPAAEWLDSRTAIHTVPLDLHPGAVRFYRDAKE
jgi:TRAP transporter TAXI family solute receptor